MSESVKTVVGSADELSRPDDSQAICLSGKQGAFTIHNCNVSIHACKMSEATSMATGSNKVQVTTITNQVWEIPKRRGSMVASSKDYVAYILQGKNGYMLRVIQPSTTNRVLLKCAVSDIICDISFMHRDSNLLACVDGGGNLHVWDLDKAKQNIAMAQPDALKLIIQHSSVSDDVEHRITWCPYVCQEDGDQEEPTLILAISHGNNIEAADLQVLFRNYPTGITVPSDRVGDGLVSIPNAHQKTITDLSMSPDGMVLASSSEDGHLKFWQIDWENKTHKCLHDYVPHNGAPVTRLIFCDDHTNRDSSTQFWRFLITAANDSSEVKLWCTITWKCLQTISFHPPVDQPTEPHPHVLLSLDHSAKYLLAADSHRMVLNILQLFQDGITGDASFISLTEYPLTQPIISFVVVGNKPLPLEESGDELDTSPVHTTQFDSRRNGVVLDLYCIQTKSMQEMHVRFEPPDIVGVPPPAENLTLMETQGKDVLNIPQPQPSTEPAEQPPLLPPTHFPSLLEAAPIPTPVRLFTPSDLVSSSSLFLPGSNLTLPGSTLQSTSLPSLSQMVPPKTSSLLYPLSLASPTLTTIALSQSVPAESSSFWLSSGPQEKLAMENLHTLPQDSDGEEEREADIAAHERFMELIKPDHPQASVEGGTANPYSYEQFVQALDEKRELSPTTKAPKNKEIPQGEGEGQSISGDEETESAGAEVVVSQELSGEEVGEVTAPPLLSDKEEEGGGEVGGAGWSDLMIESRMKPVQLLIVDETGEESFPRVVERGANSFVEREDASKDGSDASQDHEVAEEDVVVVRDEALNQPGHQSTSQPHQDKEPGTKYSEQEMLEVPEAAPVTSKRKATRRRRSKAKNSGLQEAVNSHSDGEPPPASSEPLNTTSIAELQCMVAKQQEEIKELKELHSRSVVILLHQLSGISAPILEELKAMSLDQQQRYDRLNKEGALEKQKQDKFLNTLTTTINTKLEKLVKQEMKTTVLPAVMAAVEQKSSVAANVAVQEAVRGALASKELVEALAVSVSHSIQRVVSGSYDQAFRSTVLPSFEKACQEMFRQVDEAFRAGTTEYLTQLQRQRQQDPAPQQLMTAVCGVQNHVAQLSAPNSPLVQALQGSLHQEMQPMSQQLQLAFVEAIRRELGTAFERQVAVLNTVLKAEVGAAFDRNAFALNTQMKAQEEKKNKEEEIQHLLAAKQLNKAFEVALSTSDLSMVTFLCQQVTPDEVFGSADCPLTQPVLLSLIQQLSVNLSDNLDLKIGYLESSILSLDPKSDTVRNHMTPVLSGLTQGLASVEKSIELTPESAGLCKQVRRLRKIAERLCLGR